MRSLLLTASGRDSVCAGRPPVLMAEGAHMWTNWTVPGMLRNTRGVSCFKMISIQIIHVFQYVKRGIYFARSRVRYSRTRPPRIERILGHSDPRMARSTAHSYPRWSAPAHRGNGSSRWPAQHTLRVLSLFRTSSTTCVMRIELRQALVSYQDYHMVLLALAGRG